jgi:hypothetical protein
VSEQAIPELLASVFRRYFQVEAFGGDWQETLRRELHYPDAPGRSEMFRQQLAEAILHHTVSPTQYEQLTEEEFDTPEDLEAWLREVWQHLYGDEPVTLTDTEAVVAR